MITCAHCGRRPGGFVPRNGQPLCYPDDPSLPACYLRVRDGLEPLGALIGVEPKPPGMIGIAQDKAWRELVDLGQELQG